MMCSHHSHRGSNPKCNCAGTVPQAATHTDFCRRHSLLVQFSGPHCQRQVAPFAFVNQHCLLPMGAESPMGADAAVEPECPVLETHDLSFYYPDIGA